MIYVPAPDWRYVFKRGMQGTDVAALQLNLAGVLVEGHTIPVDGDFGRDTYKAVYKFQGLKGLVQDGIAGGKTQETLIVDRSQSAADRWGLPPGLLKSIAAQESGGYVAAYSPHPSDQGFDIGAYQKSVPPAQIGNQQWYENGYNVKYMAAGMAAKFSELYTKFVAADYVLNHISKYGLDLAPFGVYKPRVFAWQLAVLSHNWPYAADQISRRGHIFNNPDQDDWDASWVIEASGGRLRTARQWVYNYITKATVYVEWT